MHAVRWLAVAALLVPFASGGSAWALPEEGATGVRLEGLGARQPDRILVLVVRGEGISAPVVAFQERSRKVIEEHLHARVVSMEEAFVRGGAEFQAKLAMCKGEDSCYARLVGAVEANYLLVITASKVGDLRVVGSRLIDLDAVTARGNAVDAVPEGRDVLDVLPERIKASVPESMWDPFGALSIEVNVAGAEVSVGGRPAGVSPLPRIEGLLPGVYPIAVSKSGFKPGAAEGRVARGETSSVKVALEEESSFSGWWIWAIVGVAAAAGAATAIGVAASGGEATFCSSPDPAACAK